MRAFPAERYGAVRSGAADAAAVAQIADKLVSAKHPVMVTSYAGRNLEAPALIEEIARAAGIRVFEAGPLYLNISRASPCFAGMMPAIAEADVGLLVDVDVPWIPTHTKENPQTWWAHVDVDVVKECFPIWGFASNARVQGDSVLILRQLLAALKAKATPAFREAAAKRVEAMRSEGNERRAGLAKQAAEKGKRGAINPHYLCAEISKTIGDDAIVVNEGIRNGPVVNNQIMRTRPGSSIGFAGGGLGSSSGTALGIKLEKPEAAVVQMVGDGGFYFGNPSSVYAVSKQYRLPILTVLFDNSGWSAVKEATLRVYPEGEAKATNEFNALLAPDIEFAKVCEAAGGYGERVTDPDAVPAAIQRCLKEVRGGRAALLAQAGCARSAFAEVFKPGAVPTVDSLSIRVLTDSSYDTPRPGTSKWVKIKRSPLSSAADYRKVLHNEWGLSLSLESRIGGDTRNLMLDYGYTSQALLNNMDVMGVDGSRVQGMILSHGHYDHLGGMIGFLQKYRDKLPADLTLYVGGEDNFCNRKTASGAPGHFSDWGVLDRRDLEALKVKIVYCEQPTIVMGHAFTTGSIARRSFERVLPNTQVEYVKRNCVGCDMPAANAKAGGKLVPDEHLNEHGTCFNVKDRGLVVITSCGHAGVVNTARHAMEVSGVGISPLPRKAG